MSGTYPSSFNSGIHPDSVDVTVPDAVTIHDVTQGEEMASTTKTDSENALPTTEAEIDELRQEIDRLDAEILAAIQRRSEVSQLIGRTRMASGGPRMVHSREMKVLDRFSSLGQEGHTLAMLLLRLGRGRLGR
ncbi:chorismate mutase [Rhodococcus sp. H36-A4]|nr:MULTISPECIES: chorismate mutase [unclassified Rhodococcus (in: high G+C Gram-positive bacteria)]MCZ4076532.1 chorismate mutase [Rhodococcus sp. H36-A4]MDJ0360397.1 chorismate mutase [Rhodococcus sp. H29-C3]